MYVLVCKCDILIDVSVSLRVCMCVIINEAYLISVDASGLLRAVTQFAHLAADTIVNGAATSHSAPADQADRMYTPTHPHTHGTHSYRNTTK